MRQRSFILVAGLVTAMIVGAVAIYAYDSSRDDLIAEGVTVASVDVGGLRADDARAVVERRVADSLEQPVTVTHGRRRFVLSPESARLRADVGGMVDEALKGSRDGNVISRVARDITGGEENVQVGAKVHYSQAAVARFSRRVATKVDQPPRDARVDFPSLARVKEQNGFSVKRGVLERRVARALKVPDVERAVKAPTKVTHPKVTRAELADKYPSLIVINRGGFQLKYYRRLRHVKTYTIAVGQVGLETPAGLYRVQNKAVNPAWSVPNSSWAGSLAGTVVPGGTPQNPLKARWLGIYDGAGIHGTDQIGSLGTAASHGCIRMAIPDVIELYDKVPVGAPVYVA
jgi:lipoprotein-anchoring transpeptidase ErfK/SrfK